MPAKNIRFKITVTSEFHAWLAGYAQSVGLSMSEALLLSLAQPAIRAEGFDGEVMLGRGRYKRSKDNYQLDLERLDVLHLGLPPLADDDE